MLRVGFPPLCPPPLPTMFQAKNHQMMEVMTVVAEPWHRLITQTRPVEISYRLPAINRQQRTNSRTRSFHLSSDHTRLTSATCGWSNPPRHIDWPRLQLLRRPVKTKTVRHHCSHVENSALSVFRHQRSRLFSSENSTRMAAGIR